MKRRAPAVLDPPQFKAWHGFTTEQVPGKLYTWMHRLKILCEDYPDSPKLRERARLSDI
jgi:hypothetical protein